MLVQRLFWIAIACAWLSLAHLFFRRKSTKGLLADGRLSGSGWSVLMTVVSLGAVALSLLLISPTR
jgi:hypothetical protein